MKACFTEMATEITETCIIWANSQNAPQKVPGEGAEEHKLLEQVRTAPATRRSAGYL